MGRQKGSLRIAVDDWIQNNVLTLGIFDWWERVTARNEEWADLLEGAFDTIGIAVLLYLPLWIPAGLVYALTGADAWIRSLRMISQKINIEAALDEYANFWRRTLASAEGSQIFEILGGFFSEPLLAAIEAMNRSPSENPDEYVRRIYGVLTALTIGPGIAATALEAVGAGQLETPAAMLRTLGSALDLGVLGGSIAAPMVESGIVAQMRRSLKARFRPTRFSASELRDLWALGEISDGAMRAEARELGWREDDIALWLRLAFRKLSESDIWSLFKAGQISRDEVAERLRAMGFDPDDIPLLFKVNAQDDANEAETITKSTARQAFREGLIGEAELAQILSALGLADREVQLVVELEKMGRATDNKALTVGQIKTAWEENVLSDPEATHYLEQEGFGRAEIGVLLSTWKLENEPTFRKLNKGTIIGAYIAGVINRSQARLKLMDVGLAEEDARLELDLAEARNPEAFGRSEPAPSKQLTAGTLADLVQSDLLPPERMADRLLEIGYSEEDAQLLTAAAVQRKAEELRPLTQSLIESAYVHGVLTRSDTLARLEEIGFDEADAVLVLDTVEAENPAVFYPESVTAVRLPSIGALTEALRAGIVNDQAYFDGMAALGYDSSTARLYLSIAQRQERKSSKGLTQSQIANAYSDGLFAWGEAMLRLTQLGYTDDDSVVILQLEHVKIQDTDVWNLLLDGRVDPQSAFQQLLSMGYSEEDLNEAIASL